jgi:hypothetical protein
MTAMKLAHGLKLGGFLLGACLVLAPDSLGFG